VVPSEHTISIVIATRNRSAQLATALDRLLCLDEAEEIIVLDNHSSDDTVRVARSFPQVRVIELERNFGAGARTLGVRIAHTPYVAFSDDDSWWQPGSLSRASELFASYPRLGLIAARVLVGQDERLDPIAAEMRMSPLEPKRPAPGRPVLGFLACGAIVRRTAFLDVSGFEERFGIGGEEQLLALDLVAADWDVTYIDELVALHHPQPSGDRADRKKIMIRNELWSSWLRRPAPVALVRTLKVLRQAPRESASQAALFEALKGLPWILERRKVLPKAIERNLRTLELTLKGAESSN
jgi:GT2 family glycosyltransferase